MDYIFIGSGVFASNVLINLPQPTLIVTQKDKLGGRGLKTLIPSDVKKTCQTRNLSFTEISAEAELVDILTSYKEIPILLTDFGRILTPQILNIPKFGIWNLHPSLLPKYRGTTPVQTAILNNEIETGITLIKMDEQIDHGPILAQVMLKIEPEDTTLSLYQKLGAAGAAIAAQAINKPQLSLENATPQKHSQATHTNKLSKADGFIEFERLVPYLLPLFKKYNLLHLLPNNIEKPIDPLELHNMVRALSPWPGVWSKTNNNKVVKFLKYYLKDKVIQMMVIENKTYTAQ
jgi:methionyl-tRNA formyltransferase